MGYVPILINEPSPEIMLAIDFRSPFWTSKKWKKEWLPTAYTIAGWFYPKLNEPWPEYS